MSGPHVLKLLGSYKLPAGLTVGASALLASGVPLNRYGSRPYWPYWSFVRPRGTAGRTPATWTLDVRVMAGSVE
ncbi:MAG: hypothetical protein ACT443_11470 [Gemmatimonadota bacterium]